MCKCIRERIRSLLEWVESLPFYQHVIIIFFIMIMFTVGIDKTWIAAWFGDGAIYYDVANFLYFITGFFTAILAVIAYINFKLINKTNSQSNLLKIDERWSSPEIIKARQIIHVLYRTACDEVKFEEQYPKITLEKHVYPKIARAIVQMSISKHKDIRSAFIYLLNYLEFMESLGFLYKKEPSERIKELEAFCGHTLVFNYGIFYSYIKYKNKKHETDHMFFKEFENLIKYRIKGIKVRKKIKKIKKYQNNYKPKDAELDVKKNSLLRELVKWYK